jgi:coenzyme F420-reducing hydrogenase delta subunit
MNIVVRGCHNLVPFRKRVEQRGRGAEEPNLGLLPCSSKIEAHQILHFFEHGADAVLILACPEGACRQMEGNRRAARRAAYAAEWLTELGLNPGRLKFVSVEADQAPRLDDLIADFSAEMAALGPTGLAGLRER